MSTSTEVEIDLESILDETLPCTGRINKQPCPHEPTWLAKGRCETDTHTRSGPLCELHFQALLEGVLTCDGCVDTLQEIVRMRFVSGRKI